MASHEALREKLEARLAALTSRMQKLQADLRRTPHRDSEERAVDLQNDEVLTELDGGGLAEIEQVRAALVRMQAGSYGRCTRCGEDIDVRRLEALPFAATCVGCAR